MYENALKNAVKQVDILSRMIRPHYILNFLNDSIQIQRSTQLLAFTASIRQLNMATVKFVPSKVRLIEIPIKCILLQTDFCCFCMCSAMNYQLWNLTRIVYNLQ